MTHRCCGSSTCSSYGGRVALVCSIHVGARVLRWRIAGLRAIASRGTVVVTVTIVVVEVPASAMPAVPFKVLGIIISASIVRALAPCMSSASVSGSAGPLLVVVVVVVAWASVFVLVTVPAVMRTIASAAAVAFFIFLTLSALALLLLVEASGDFLEPAVRYLVGTIHDASQH